MGQVIQSDYVVKSVRPAAVLTNSYVPGTSLLQTETYSQLVLQVDFTLGGLTTAEVKIEFSQDQSSWSQESFGIILSGNGTVTMFLAEHEFISSGIYTIDVPILTRYIRISSKGTGAVGGSSMAITAILGIIA